MSAANQPGLAPRVVSPVEEGWSGCAGVERITRGLDVIISVDTSSPAVMRETARLGPGLINDVRSLRRDGAGNGCGYWFAGVPDANMLGEPGDAGRASLYDHLVAR